MKVGKRKKKSHKEKVRATTRTPSASPSPPFLTPPRAAQVERKKQRNKNISVRSSFQAWRGSSVSGEYSVYVFVVPFVSSVCGR